jgi:glycosyltransferase involved in cell wall biosynthesis
MYHGQKIAVVMPAYNAERTLARTFEEVPRDLVDEVILTDDASQDATVEIARGLGIHTLVHPRNRGYGGNQKTCYAEALRLGADVVIMLHPDYQYTPRLIAAMATLIIDGPFDVVLGSRILGGRARAGGMPLYKYVANRFLTASQNLLCGSKLSEFHTGYRGFSRKVLETLPLEENSDDFVFDNQMLAQAIYAGFEIGEISCPAAYFPEASSINFRRSVTYGLGVLETSVRCFLERRGWHRSRIFSPDGRTLLTAPVTELVEGPERRSG